MLVEHVFNNRQLSWFSALKALVAQVCGKGSISGPLTPGDSGWGPGFALLSPVHSPQETQGGEQGFALLSPVHSPQQTQGGDQALHCYLRSTHPRRLRVGSRALHCYLRSTHPSRLRVGSRALHCYGYSICVDWFGNFSSSILCIVCVLGVEEEGEC